MRSPHPPTPPTQALLVCLLLMSLWLTPASASEALFASDEVLAITVSAPFEQIDIERDKSKEYEGTLSYHDPELGPTTLDAKFSVRGNFRLRKDICSYSQLWVNLKKGQVKGTLFAGQNKIKLVVQCRDADYYREYIVREQQAYSIFREFSDLSLATRLLSVSYVDPEAGSNREHLGLFIQHHKNLAEEHGMENYEEERAAKERLEPEQADRVAMFMYLVSNTDYSFVAPSLGDDKCCHNIKLLEDSEGTLHPVPYDFDSTGFVNARYAEPAAGIRQRNVRQRIYRGYCAPEPLTMATSELFRQKRDAVYSIIDDPARLSERSLKMASRYIDDFYEVLESSGKFNREITKKCR